MLTVAEFDPVEIENAQTVGQNEGVQCENLEHLQGGHQGASTLFDDVTD